MPLNITSEGEAPRPSGPAKYVPTRHTPGPNSNVAPIAGQSDSTVQAPTTQQEAAAAEGEGGQGGQEESEARDLAWRFSTVARKEAKARQRIEEAKARESAIRLREEDLEAREARAAASEEEDAARRRDPERALQAYGFTLDGAMQYFAQDRRLTPEQQQALRVDEMMAAERKARREEQDQLRQQFEEQQAEREAAEQQQEEQQAQEEIQLAVEETKAEIRDILDQDPKSFYLVRKANRGVDVIYAKVEEMSDKQFKDTGRRPPLTTKLLELAAKEIERLAREEYSSVANDPEGIEALGLGGRPLPRRPTTLPNRLAPARPGTSTPARLAADEGQGRPESAAERTARFKKAVLQPLLDSGKAR